MDATRDSGCAVCAVLRQRLSELLNALYATLEHVWLTRIISRVSHHASDQDQLTAQIEVVRAELRDHDCSGPLVALQGRQLR